MSRLSIIPVNQTSGKSAQLFEAIKKAMGKVPNAYLTIGSHAPEVLSQTLQHNASLRKGTLSNKQIEAINLAVSEASGCDYCLAAHTLTAQKAGYSREQTLALRRGNYPEDTAVNALVHFVRTLVTTRGTMPEPGLNALRAAGFSEQQVVEIISAVSAILFTNMLNRANDTDIDFPPAESLHPAG